MLNTEAVKPGSVKAWMAFTRPKTWGVAVAPVIAALSLALFETGRFDGLTAFFTMTIALLMQIISNMKNDLGYTEKKAETGNRRGLPRAQLLKVGFPSQPPEGQFLRSSCLRCSTPPCLSGLEVGSSP